jgi:peptidoglycan/LPS O-acetylase OafA/YrhL
LAGSWLAFLVVGLFNFLWDRLSGQGLIPMSTLGWPVNFGGYHQYVLGYTLINLATIRLVAMALNINKTCIGWSRDFLPYLGNISYGIYVFYCPVIEGVQILMQKA